MAEYFDNDLVQDVVETIRSSTLQQEDSIRQQCSDEKQQEDSPFKLETPVGIKIIEANEKPICENSNRLQQPALTLIDESKRASIGKFLSLKHNSNLTSDGEEFVAFSARLIEEGDSSGFIYQSRNDDSGMLIAS